ncbi:hypothetical protein GCM10009555_041690 [Acrocarpospora macrocephala]|uniref:Uncharacterized protein n=1 Tax=Acrocarpospora macrocephala TaxID=150177 RepID=A0A5M3X6H0_9ACTN|nr:hypothetical protein Amac_073450 [Acrocarpospora macrocephala]
MPVGSLSCLAPEFQNCRDVLFAAIANNKLIIHSGTLTRAFDLLVTMVSGRALGYACQSPFTWDAFAARR